MNTENESRRESAEASYTDLIKQLPTQMGIKRLPWFKRSVPYAALTLSLISIAFTWVISAQTTDSQSVTEQYQVFIDLAERGIDNPNVVHLLTLPESYGQVACEVAQYVSRLPPAEQAAYTLKERAAADYIFTLFERSVYQQSVTSGWRGRMLFSRSGKVNDEVVEYFTGRLLRNPRLLWYWREDGGGLLGHFEPETIQRYNAGVLHNPNLPLRSTPSPTLPTCGPPDAQNVQNRQPQS